jgi:hypothetical protein
MLYDYVRIRSHSFPPSSQAIDWRPRRFLLIRDCRKFFLFFVFPCIIPRLEGHYTDTKLYNFFDVSEQKVEGVDLI